MQVIPQGIPAGVVLPFGGSFPPVGYLTCDGSLVSRSVYAALFAAVGIIHGSGDGATTFHLPDLRGRFVRGSDNMGTGAAGRDAGTRTASNSGGATSGAGTAQADDTRTHAHGSGWYAWRNDNGAYHAVGTMAGHVRRASDGYGMGSNEVNITTSSAGGAETRPLNAAMNYIIKI
jgi:microcystin-dependent protein